MPKREIVPGVLVLTSKKDSNGERRKATILEKIEVDDQGKPLKTTTGKPTYKWKVRMNDDKSIATLSFNALKIDAKTFRLTLCSWVEETDVFNETTVSCTTAISHH